MHTKRCYVQFTNACLIVCTHDVGLAGKKSPTASQVTLCREQRANLNMPGTCFSPSLVWAWHSPCTWLAEGPHQTCPPDWEEGGLVGQRGWSAVESRTGRGRAPSWPRPRPDTPSPLHRTAGSWRTVWSDLCLHCSRTDLRRNNTGIRINTHKQNYKPHNQGSTDETNTGAGVHGAKLLLAHIWSTGEK